MIDTHFHKHRKSFSQTFPFLQYRDGRYEIVAEGNAALLDAYLDAAGVESYLEPGVELESNAAALAAAQTDPKLHVAVGVHPTRCIATPWRERRRLAAWAKDPHVVAVGETGLDFHYARPEQHRFRQLCWFLWQLRLADRLRLPLVLHVRGADAAALRVLRLFRTRLHGGSVHCFQGDAALARQYTALGFSVGIGGALLQEDAAPLCEAVRALPLERILLETDAPFVKPLTGLEAQMSKKKLRSVRNTPLILPAVIERIAALKGVSPEEVERVTSANARALFILTPNKNL